MLWGTLKFRGRQSKDCSTVGPPKQLQGRVFHLLPPKIFGERVHPPHGAHLHRAAAGLHHRESMCLGPLGFRNSG